MTWWHRSSFAKRLGAIEQTQQALRKSLDEAMQAITATRQDLNHLHFQVDQLRQKSDPRRPEAEPEGDEELRNLLDAAAGIAYAEICCHRDTYDFVVTAASSKEHFRLPAIVTENADLTEARLSGRSLVAILEALHEKRSDGNAGTASMAKRPYKCIKRALKTVRNTETRAADRREERPVVRIVIDDRPTAAA